MQDERPYSFRSYFQAHGEWSSVHKSTHPDLTIISDPLQSKVIVLHGVCADTVASVTDALASYDRPGFHIVIDWVQKVQLFLDSIDGDRVRDTLVSVLSV